MGEKLGGESAVESLSSVDAELGRDGLTLARINELANPGGHITLAGLEAGELLNVGNKLDVINSDLTELFNGVMEANQEGVPVLTRARSGCCVGL